VPAPDNQTIFDIVTNAITKYDAERSQYTKEVYAAQANATSTTNKASN